MRGITAFRSCATDSERRSSPRRVSATALRARAADRRPRADRRRAATSITTTTTIITTTIIIITAVCTATPTTTATITIITAVCTTAITTTTTITTTIRRAAARRRPIRRRFRPILRCCSRSISNPRSESSGRIGSGGRVLLFRPFFVRCRGGPVFVRCASDGHRRTRRRSLPEIRR